MTPAADTETQAGAAARHLAEGDVATALTLVAPLVAAEPPTLPPRFVLAMAAWQMGRLDHATALMQECHRLWPMEGAVAEVLASLHAQAGNLVDSLYMGKLAIALGGAGAAFAPLLPDRFPSFERAFLTISERPLFAQAKLDLADGKLADALDRARQHVALHPLDQEGVAFLAATLLRAGEASAAVAALAPSADEPDVPAALTSLYARALALVGDADEARRRHQEAVRRAPEDAVIAAAPIADGWWIAPDAAALAAAGAGWVERFSPPPTPRQGPRPDGKLVIAYLIPALADPLDGAAVAALALAHDRARARAVGYGAGAQSAAENAGIGLAFDAWRDVAAVDAPTLARFLARDGVHAIVDAAGFSTPHGLLALGRAPDALRLAWLGDPAGLGTPIYDARLDAATFYPVPQDMRHIARDDERAAQFGADVRLPQLDAETVATWSTLLEALPEAKLLLRAHGMDRATVDRLVARFGRALAARIDLVTAARVDEFYAKVDVALAPRRGASPRLAAEAIACFVPTVAFAGESRLAPYAAFLRAAGLGDALVASDRRDYVGIALALACSADARASLHGAMTEAAQRLSPAALARSLEGRVRRLMTDMAA